jgi:hypothetical protein
MRASIPQQGGTVWLAAVLVGGLLTCASAQGPVPQAKESAAPQVGDLLPRIRCAEDYEARVYAINLQAPDGLTMNAKGELIVVEETAGQVTRIGVNGKHFAVAAGLRSPEGIARDLGGVGNNYLVVEDLLAGRLASIVPKKNVQFHDFTFDACEGVLVHGDTLYITDSNAQLVENPFSGRTRLLALPRKKDGWGEPQVILERRFPFSFSEIVAEDSDHLFLLNESAGGFIRDGLLRLDLRSGTLKPFATGLVSPEGLCPTPSDAATTTAKAGFPLFVAEEDRDGKGHGRLSRIDARGKRTTFAIGFEMLEDVFVAEDGRIFVSEDATGLIIELRPKGLKKVAPRLGTEAPN